MSQSGTQFNILTSLAPRFLQYICQATGRTFRFYTTHTTMTDSHFNAEDSQLVADLHRISQKSPKLVRSTVYSAPSDPTVKVRSWKMNEFKYYDVPSPFPTLARGLFSRELEQEAGSDQPRYQIIARGYDKFFNIGEVPWTDVSSKLSCEENDSDPVSFALCVIVVVLGGAYWSRVHVVGQVKRMHHLHRCHFTLQVDRHVQTRPRGDGWRLRNAFPSWP